jgi:hypothetical protein
LQVIESPLEVGFIKHLFLLHHAEQERNATEIVDLPGYAFGLFVNGVEKTVAENSLLAASHEQMVLDVTNGAFQVERGEVKRDANALTEGIEGGKAEFESQVRLAEEDENKAGGGVHLGVKQKTKLLEEVRGELVGLINDEEGTPALAVGIVEGITELGQHLAEGVSGLNLKAKQDLTIEDGGVEMGIGQVNDGKELAVEGMSESTQSGRLANADIAGDQGG